MVELFCGEWRPEYLEGPLVPVAFKQCVARHSNAPCLIDEDGNSMTYAEVDAAATTLARRLVARGVKKDTAVGILFDRQPAVVVSMIAVHKAGGCYVPLDPNFPSDRLSIYIEDSHAVALITEPCHTQLAIELLSGLPLNPQILLYNDEVDIATHAHLELPDLSALHEDDLAYIMFTSGSTGRPKGVMVPHRGVRDLVAFNIEEFELGPKDVFCLNSTVCFDSYVTYVFASLSVGGKLVVPGPTIHLDPTGMAQLIATHGISIMEVVPALAAEYMEAFKEAGDKLKCLTHILTGGEALTPNLASLICSTLPGLRKGGLFNSYGPTEVTVTTITGHITAPFERIALGRPDHNVHAYVVIDDNAAAAAAAAQQQADAAAKPLTPKWRLAEIGEPGELWLSGPRLARGYHNRQDLTDKAFVPNPFFAEAVAALPAEAEELSKHYRLAYRTADLVVMGPDGNLEYLGRVDAQIKINGVRMEVSEVEAVLAGAPGVTHAAVKPWKDATGTYRLAGYVAPDSVDLAAAEAHCRAKLLPAMVPSKLVTQAVMPRLPNGKIDVKSLKEPEWGPAPGAGDDGKGPVEAPSTDMEQLLAGIWAEELKLQAEKLSVKANFFALGGNSLRAGLINSKIRRATGADISGLLIYQHSTITAMAAAIESRCGKFSMDLESRAGSFSVIGTALDRGGSSFSTSSGGSCTSNDASWANMRAAAAAEAAGSKDAGLAVGSAAHKHQILPVWFATLMQVVGLLLLGWLGYANIVAGLEILYWFTTARPPLYAIPLLGVGSMFIGMFSLCAYSIAMKWLLLGRMKPQTVPIWGWYYIRWWIARGVSKIALNWLFLMIRRSPMLNWYYRALGVKIGKNVVLDTANIWDWDLVEIGDDTVIETDAFVHGSAFFAGASEGERGTMVMEDTSIGKGCTILTTTIVSAGTHLQDGVILTSGSTSARPPASPSNAKAHAEVRSEQGPLPLPLCLLSAACLLVATSLMWFTILPSLVLWVHLNSQIFNNAVSLWNGGYNVLIWESRQCWVRQQDDPNMCFQLWRSLAITLCLVPPSAYVLSNAYMWLMVPLKWMLVGNMTQERMDNGGVWLQFRRHLWRSFMKGPFLTTVYQWTSTEVFCAWLRALGSKVGRQCWLSEMFRCTEFELYEVEDTASVCSLVTVVGATAGRTDRVKLGAACDVTNDCTLMPGCTVGDGAVLGVYTYGKPGQHFADNSITLGDFTLQTGGNTPIPDLEAGKDVAATAAKVDCVETRLIPTWKYTVYNILYSLGSGFVFMMTNTFMMVPVPLLAMYVFFNFGYAIAAAFLPVYFGLGFAIFLGYLAVLKRVVMKDCGGVHPIFTSVGAGKWQMMCINCHLYGDFNDLKGSLLYNWYLRAMGTKVGKEVFCLGGVVAEYEQVTIGDYSVVGDGTFLLTHTVENRHVKIRPIVIGERVTIGAMCAVLPDASMEDGSELTDMSLVMKGETVPRSAAWSGLPACPMSKFVL